MTKSKKTILVIFFIILSIYSISAKSRKNDEKRFQLGFGFTTSSANVFQFIQSFYSFKNNDTNMLSADKKDLTSNEATRQALITANMLASMQLGFQMRIMAHVFYSEIDLIAQPIENIMNSRCDFIGMVGLGIRSPTWIMPYITVGANFTISMYPASIETIEPWRKNVADTEFSKTFANWRVKGTDNFGFSLGVHSKIGLDVKFKRFSIGCYAMWQAKDLSDFDYKLKYYFCNTALANDNLATATGLLIASQFSFGASICWYLF